MANTLSAILGVLALVTCWIPVVGEVFAAAALVTGAIGMVADALLAVSGDGSWSQVAMDSLNVIPVGAAKVIGRGAIATEDGLKAASTVDKGLTAAAAPAKVPADADELVSAGGRSPGGGSAGGGGPGTPTPLEDYLSRVEQVDVSTPRSSADFYSGGRGAARRAAEDYAEQSGTTTLEQTPGGSWLDGEKLFGPDSPLTVAEAKQVWGRLSERYAEQASGHVHAFLNDPAPDSAYLQKELPALDAGLRSGRVSSVTVHDLLSDTRSVPAARGSRATLTWHDGRAAPQDRNGAPRCRTTDGCG